MKGKVIALALVLLALAGGIALGTGPLEHGKTTSKADAAAARAALAKRDASITALQHAVVAGSSFASATAARVSAGTLVGRKIALLTLPGVSPTEVKQLVGLLRTAGAEVTAQVALTPALASGKDDALLTPLTSQMASQSPGAVMPPASTAYQRLGALLARAIAVPVSAHVASAPYDVTAVSIVSGLQTADVVASSHETARAGLGVVALPARTDSSSIASLAAMIATFGAQIPTVVAGPTASAAGGGLLAALRAGNRPFSTVDGLGSATARVNLILALAARTRGVVGAYGSVGAGTAPVPPLS